MQKIQKTGFMLSGSLFMVMGIIFLFAGGRTGNSLLKTMGAVWLPLGIINFLLTALFIRKGE